MAARDEEDKEDKEDKEEQIPNEFLCPITTEIMKDPVIIADGTTYERQAIETWFETQHTSPLTGKPIENKKLIPNWALKHAIERYKSENIEQVRQQYQERKQERTELKAKIDDQVRVLSEYKSYHSQLTIQLKKEEQEYRMLQSQEKQLQSGIIALKAEIQKKNAELPRQTEALHRAEQQSIVRMEAEEARLHTEIINLQIRLSGLEKKIVSIQTNLFLQHKEPFERMEIERLAEELHRRYPFRYTSQELVERFTQHNVLFYKVFDQFMVEERERMQRGLFDTLFTSEENPSDIMSQLLADSPGAKQINARTYRRWGIKTKSKRNKNKNKKNTRCSNHK